MNNFKTRFKRKESHLFHSRLTRSYKNNYNGGISLFFFLITKEKGKKSQKKSFMDRKTKNGFSRKNIMKKKGLS